MTGKSTEKFSMFSHASHPADRGHMPISIAQRPTLLTGLRQVEMLSGGSPTPSCFGGCPSGNSG